MSIEKLIHLSLLTITGDDAHSFLQGQLSNDLQQLDNGTQWQFSGYCNPKGRLLALLYIWQENDNYYALIERELRESVQKRLQMYVLRSKVNIEHIEATALYGCQTSAQLVEAGMISGLADTQQHGGLNSLHNGWLLTLNQRTLFVQMQSDVPNPDLLPQEASGDGWINADINEGIPRVTSTISEQFVPQMLNLDLLGGISFKKGCYTGQEIVARMHYLGNLKQRMFYCELSITSEEHSSAGDRIFDNSGKQKPVGTIVSISVDTLSALVVLRLDSIEQPLYTPCGNQLVVRNQSFDQADK